MYTPSPKLCRLLIESSFKHIQAHIGEQTGIPPTLEELFEHYDATKIVGPSVSDDVYSVIDEMYAEGVAYSRASGQDCHILVVDRFKAIDQPIRNRLAERLSPDKTCDMSRVLDLLGVEFYDYMQTRYNAEGMVFMAGDLYLACVPTQERIQTKTAAPLLY
jgi:hypothetical protein